MTYHLTIAASGGSGGDETIEVKDGQTILEACLSNGIWLPYACGHGRCSTCKVDVLDGEVDHGPASPFALMDFERQEGKVLACCATLRSDVTIDAEIEEDEDAENPPLREMTARVTRIADLTPTVRGIWLAVPEDFAFQPGQYVNVHVPGVTGARAFSIASAPSERGVLELHVRRVDGGAATTFLHDTLKAGDELRLTGPLGRFFVRASRSAPRIFVAGGSGLSSVVSMIAERIESGCTVPVTLVQGARSLAELYYRERFESLAAKHPWFRYVPAISDGEADAPDASQQGKNRAGLRPRGARTHLRWQVHRPHRLPLRAAADGGGLHPRPHEGAAVREGHFYREVRHARGRRVSAREEPLVQENLTRRPSWQSPESCDLVTFSYASST